jgi:hypothetical protein
VANGLAHTSGLSHGVPGVEAAEDRGLGLAEALLQDQPAGLEGADQLHRDGGSGGEEEAQGGEIEARLRLGVERLEQRPKHGRDAPEEADPLAGHGLPDPPGVEAALEEDAPSGVEGGNRQDLEPEGVEEGQRHQHPVLGAEAEKELGVAGVVEGLSVGKQCALGAPGRARGVHEDHRIVGSGGLHRRTR